MSTIYDIESLLARSLSGESLTEEQNNALQQWISANREEYESLREIVESANSDKESDTKFNSAKAWEKVEPQLHQKTVLNRSRIVIRLSYAASLLILISLTYLIINNSRITTATYANAKNTIEKIILPDSSQIVLYPGSDLQYKAKAKGGNREVILIGKAFFKVRKEGRPFIIEAYNINVEVVGTSFLVEAKGKNHATVQVKSGIVKVSANKTNVLLKKNQQVNISANKMIKSKIAYPEYLFEERPELLKLDNTTMREVASRLEIIYNVKIDLDAKVSESRVTSQLKIGPISDILKELSYICNCQYEMISEGYYKFYYR